MAGRYTIEGEIGKGGEGSVHKAYDTQLKRHVALKRVLTPGEATPEEVEKAADSLIAEAQTLSSLSHPNIVTVFDVGKDDEGGFVVMELLNGETLDDTVARGVLTQEDFIEVVTQTMEALIAAQSINVVHRDLKPTNVMVIWQPSGRFQTKILDFGLAKFSKNPSVQTMDQDESVMGSIYFMAPEQFERAELDERTDLYSMGCVYYHSLTGLYPFRGETAPLVMNSHLQHRVTPLDKLRPDLAPSICQWVMWLINRDIDNRPDNARVALDHFPQHPEMPEEQVLQAIPIEESSSGMTTGVQAVVATHAAEAPTGMVMLANETGSRPVLGFPGGVPPKAGGGKGKLIAVVAVAVAALAAMAYFGMGVIQENNQKLKLVQLAGRENPSGGVEDVKLAMKYLKSNKASPEQKTAARKVLEELQGRGVDEAILGELKNASSSAQRVWLSQALSKRGYEEAVPDMITAFESAGGDQERLEILNALQALVTTKNITPVLDGLKKDYSLQVRTALENIVVTAYRRISPSATNIKPLMDRLAKAEGEERRSLWRILGTRGGSEVRNKLKKIFSEKHDEDYLRDAMVGLASLQTPEDLSVLLKVFEETKDGVLKVTAVKGCVKRVGLPHNYDAKEWIDRWNLALKMVQKSQDQQRVFTSIADFTGPEVVKFLEEKAKDAALKPFAEAALEKIKTVEKEAPVLEAGELLSAHRQIARADGAIFDPDVQAITNWVKPEAWFVWHFKMKESGEYNVEVSQAMEANGENQFAVIIGSTAFNSKAVDTGGWKEYRSNALKETVKLEAGKTYALFLKAGEIVQPRMMNFKGVRLHKK